MATGAELLVKTLSELGVRTIFGYPGVAILPIYDSLLNSQIRHILMSGEQGACFAAEGYARATNNVGVVLSTSGPGATNLITGIADAFMDSIPLITITGNVPLKCLGHDTFQEIDTFGVTLPITKWSVIVKEAKEIPEIVRKAFSVALSGRKGPVLIDIPSDILVQEAKYYDGKLEIKPAPIPNDEDIKAAAELINKSKKPLLYIGGGVKNSGAIKETADFALSTFAQVCESYMGLGTFNPYDGSYLGVLAEENPITNAAIKECDLVISLGARFNSRFTSFKYLTKKKIPVVQVDMDPSEINKNIQSTISIVGDIKDVLTKLNPLIHVEPSDDWAFKDEIEVEESNNRGIEIIRALNKRLGDNTIVTTDVGLHQCWTALNYKFTKPFKFLTSGGLGAMGFGLGAAIGAHLATGERVLMITSDGSFNMNFNELPTAVKHHIPLIICIMNNNSLGMIRKVQLSRGKKTPASSLYLSTDYVELAKAMGARAIRIAEDDDIETKLDEALKGDFPVVLDCRISINEGM